MLKPLFLVKIFNFEYWPWWLVYFPLYPYAVYLAIKTRSVSFFTVVNPAIDSEGFYGEKKGDILSKIPFEYLPKNTFINQNTSFHQAENQLKQQQIEYPFIAKPNIGHRGNGVEKIENAEQLKLYHSTQTEDYLIQEFIDFDVELGVFYSRLPGQKLGVVSSVTQKEFLSVTGDGISTIEQLILKSTRARFQLETLKSKLGNGIIQILKKDEKRVLETIGNHCRGTKFLNVNHLKNEQLNLVFDKILADFEGFNYGRFDMKVKSITDLYQGKNIRVMELNGISSDPAHIFDPNYSFFTALKDIAWHWSRLADISIINIKNGYKPLSIKKLYKLYKN
jgi:ATP-grasp domain